jgi:hypothetical protein
MRLTRTPTVAKECDDCWLAILAGHLKLRRRRRNRAHTRHSSSLDRFWCLPGRPFLLPGTFLSHFRPKQNNFIPTSKRVDDQQNKDWRGGDYKTKRSETVQESRVNVLACLVLLTLEGVSQR